MKSWRETLEVFGEMARLARAGRKSALATLTHVVGSSYRRPGAKLLIRDDGAMLGNVSGGCLENDLRDRAVRAIATGKPEDIHYDTGEDENVIWGLGLGCNGKIDIHLQPEPANFDEVLTRLHGDEPFELRAGNFVERLEPPTPLLVISAGEDSIPLVRLAEQCGFRVWLIDHRSKTLREDLFPGAFKRIHARPAEANIIWPTNSRAMAVIKNHHLMLDREWAVRLAETDIRYIGLLGPKARREEIMKAVEAKHRPRIFGPAGFDLGSEGPEQIAVSIVSELLAIATGRPGGHLRERQDAIHSDAKRERHERTAR